MFPERFDYYRAESVDEALALLAEHDDAELLAGGHSLVPAMKNEGRDPAVVVDLDVEDLRGLELGTGGTSVTIGALTTYADLASDDRLAQVAPVVQSAAREVGDRQIRNRGTLGGNLAEAHPAADPPAAVLASDATLLVDSRDGSRRIPAGEFFEGEGETALGEGEILTGVEVPGQQDVGTAYHRRTHPATGYALVGVAAVVSTVQGTVLDARVAATGVVDRAVRLSAVEDELLGSSVGDGVIEAAASEAGTGLNAERLRSDPQASGEFRVSLLETCVERTVSDAVEDAESDGMGF
jgi:carbon-monoxide dehydrogenase medium subunit